MPRKRTEREILKSKAREEIYRCSNDPIYFIENYCKIKHQIKGLLPFKLYDYQKEVLKAFLAHDRTIINKARQLGFSTVIAAFIVWHVMFHNNKDVLIIANKKDVAKELLKKVKLILNYVPNWMYLADMEENNVHTITFSNGGSVKAIAKSNDAGRSLAVSLLVFDEAAHIEGMDELWKGAASTTATGGKIIAASTPQGIGNWFHDTFTKAESGELPDWHPFITHWWENPDFAEGIEDDPNTPGGKTSPWFRKATQGWSRQQIAQELLTSFIESGANFFHVDTMQYYESIQLDPNFKEGPDRNLWVWKRPVPGYRYLISADVCHGNGEDYAAATVFELKEMEIVAEYKGKMPPDMFGDYLIDLGEQYNEAYICPENQGVGLACCLHIKNMGYRNLCYFSKDSGRLIDQWAAEYHGIHPGQPMQFKDRTMILAKAEEFFRKKQVISYSKRLVYEMHTFVIKNQKPQAEKNMNDDLIMAAAIGIWVRDVCPEFRGPIASADRLSLINGITTRKKEFEGTNSVQRKVREERRRIRRVLEEQKVPINRNPHAYKWLYKM